MMELEDKQVWLKIRTGIIVFARLSGFNSVLCYVVSSIIFINAEK